MADPTSTRAPVVYGVSELQKYNPRLVLTVLFRRRWAVLAVFLPIFLIGIWGTLNSTDEYIAESQVLIEARSVEAPEFSHLPVENEVLVSTAVQISQSIPVAEMAAASIADDFMELKDRFPSDFDNVSDEEDLKGLLQRGVGAAQIGESNVVEIVYSHPVREFALMADDAITNAFLDYNVNIKQNKKALTYYSEQIAEVEADIEGLMSRRLAVFSSGGLNAYKEHNASGIQHMRATEYDYYQVKARRMGLEKKYTGILAAIENDLHFIPALTSGGRNSNLIGARQVYDDAVLELAQIKQTYNDSHAYVLRQQQYVEEAEGIFFRIRDSFVQDMEVELEIVKGEEDALLASLDDYRKDLLVFPSIEKELYAIDLEIDSRKDLLEALQLKRGEIRLKAYGDQRISNITRLNESTVKRGVQGSKKIIYLIMTTVLGLVLSLVVGMVIDSLDHRIYDVQQAEIQLAAPVLGAISATEPDGKFR